MASERSDSAVAESDLTCWYINIQRIADLVGREVLADLTSYLGGARCFADVQRNPITTTILNAAFKDALIDWARAAKPRTFGQLAVADDFAPGRVFSVLEPFYCKGLGRHRGPQATRLPPPVMHTTINHGESWTLRMKFSPKNLTTETAWGMLSGHTRLFAVAVVTKSTGRVVEASPYVVATFVDRLDGSAGMTYWANRREVHVDSIDTFSRVKDEAVPNTSEMAALKDIPEREVKRAFAEIIGEPEVPDDWGGERSDLLSPHVRLEGRRITTAFAFKGPAKFRKMTMASLGKNGDQIARLFSEPADLLVLQHCHYVDAGVWSTMRAFATTLGQPRLFCVINGSDTLRVLRAYGKCGFTSKPRPPDTMILEP